jgi:signal transduction histidine kinase
MIAHRACERRAGELVAERDDLLALVAHDLKNPLTAIQGLARLVRARLAALPDPSDPRLLNQLAAIEESVSDMRRLVEHLLDLACEQRGQPLALARQPTDLVTLATDRVAAHRRRAPRHRLDLRACASGLVGSWDAARIERVIDNLLDNAVAYSLAGGEVSVALRRQVDAAGAWAVLEVRDAGIGIPAADLPHIFEPFRRGSNVGGRFAGDGLGLAGVRWIVEQHGGTVGAASVEGGGTTITVRLPLGTASGHAGEMIE